MAIDDLGDRKVRIYFLNSDYVTAYDVHDNTDLFFKDSPDGVNVIIVGSFGKYNEPLAIVGGNSSVQGLNWQGNELFWNVVSGKVCSIITFDFDKDGENEVNTYPHRFTGFDMLVY